MINEIIDEMKAKMSARCGMNLTAEETREVLTALTSAAEVQASLRAVEFVPSDEIAVSEEPEAKSEVAEISEVAEPPKEELKGHLPQTFPGFDALAEAGINTYHQVRKQRDSEEGLIAVAGIGPATAAHIEEALKG